MSQNVPEKVPENVPEKVPEKVPENVPENVNDIEAPHYNSYDLANVVILGPKIKQNLKELSFCHKLKSSDPNIFAT